MRHTPLILAVVLVAAALSARADDYPQWLGPRRDNVYREKDLAPAFPPAGPKVLWRAPVGGGYAGTVVRDNAVFGLGRYGVSLENAGAGTLVTGAAGQRLARIGQALAGAGDLVWDPRLGSRTTGFAAS